MTDTVRLDRRLNLGGHGPVDDERPVLEAHVRPSERDCFPEPEPGVGEHARQLPILRVLLGPGGQLQRLDPAARPAVGARGERAGEGLDLVRLVGILR